MALTISWSKKAVTRLGEIAVFLEIEFGHRMASDFVLKVYKSLSVVSVFPEIGSMEYPALNIRGLVIFPQITLFYQVLPDKLVLLNFYDNRQNPKSVRY
jgi:plasmid stabilization system protein ParE